MSLQDLASLPRAPVVSSCCCLGFRVEAVMPCWHLHRQLSLLTHLDLPVEAHCRSSFVDSSRLVLVSTACVSLVSIFVLHCLAAADLDASGLGGACCPFWALTLFLLALLHTRSQISLFVVQSVDDAFFLVPHRLL